MGLEIIEQALPRELLYICDEAFFTGTAAEVTHLSSVDRIPVGDGNIGPITRRIQNEYMNLVNGRVPDRFGWITPVRVGAAKTLGEPVLA